MSIQNINLELVLAKLPFAEGAAFDSYRNQHDARCHPNTRIELLRDITQWVDDKQSKCIFWLSGMAGTGKSTISRTVAQVLADKQQLGASFFFKRREGDRGRANRFFTTIASQLVRSVPEIGPVIFTAINMMPDISEKRMKDQFEKLLLHPLIETKADLMMRPAIVIIIDALDECDNEDDIKSILHLFSQLHIVQGARIRIFITTRPEPPVRSEFERISEAIHRDVILTEIPKNVIEADISTFMTSKLDRIRNDNRLDENWPGDQISQILVQTASPSFISAATICRFIGDARWDPQEQLEVILKHSTRNQASKFDQTYRPVLDRLFAGCNDAESATLLNDFLRIVGSIIILEEPLSSETIAKLLTIPQKNIDRKLDALHSVLYIPTDPHQPVRLLHLSFRDFLVDPVKQDKFKFWVDERQAHSYLAKKCLEILERPGVLKQNICDLIAPGTLRSEISTMTIQQYLSKEVQYACRYWVDHLVKSKEPHLWSEAYAIFKAKFLYWLEAMSLMGRLSESLIAINLLQNTEFVSSLSHGQYQILTQLCEQLSKTACISEHLLDTKRFTLANRTIIETAPLQIYHSALIFAPEESCIRKVYNAEIPKWVLQAPRTQANWGAALATLQGHRGPISALVFSPDGKRLASGSGLCVFYPRPITVWDVESGAILASMNGHDAPVCAITFSQDGIWLASGSTSGTVVLWNVGSGAVMATFKDHSNPILAMAFSLDGKQLASFSIDGKVRLWDVESGVLVKTYEGYGKPVNALAFSPDGNSLALGAADGTIKLCRVGMGAVVTMIEGDGNPVDSLTFSPDGKKLALGWEDGMVSLRDLESGMALATVGGHGSSVHAIAYSPDGKHLALGLRNSMITLWEAESGTALATLEGHGRNVYAVAFSPDGKRLASGSHDQTIKLWDGEYTTARNMHDNYSSSISAVAISSDGKQSASGSDDGTIKQWDFETGAVVTIHKGQGGGVLDITYSPNGTQLASGSSDGIVRLLNVESGEELATQKGHDSMIYTISFSPDSKRLASGSSNGTIMLWDGESGTALATLEGDCDNGCVLAVAFSPDGKQLASGSLDNTVRLWDIASGMMLKVFKTGDILDRLSFSHTGSYLYRVGGIIKFERTPNSATNKIQDLAEISVSDQWISVGGRELLWLPPEYRPSCVTAVGGQRIFLGHSSGRVSFFRFDIGHLNLS
jgi:WD40 repeat protein